MINNHIKEKLIIQQKNNITKDGFLIVSSERTSSQQMNLKDCVKKIRLMIENANKPDYVPTAEDVRIKELR